MGSRFCRGLYIAILSVLTLAVVPDARAYSVLTHEAIVDSAWDKGICPALLKRFPNASAEDLRRARAQAYGGCIIQDLGYYPFGSKFFTDLVHYVRTADFITSLIKQSQTIDEYGFALGALAHYAADNNGHSIGVNRSVPLIYPKLKARYGDFVTYAENPSAHLKTEFGFDVLQAARGNYLPERFHDFIGFEVSKPLLERAFEQTYCMPLKDLFLSLDLALGTYRRSVSTLLPNATRIAWQKKHQEIEKTNPGVTEEKFIYRLTRREYEKNWGAQYEKPGIGSKILAVLMKIVPRVGYFKALSFRPPDSESEKLFIKSFEVSSATYLALLEQLRSGKLSLQDRDFDTGRSIRAGEYPLCDETYSELLNKLSRHRFQNVSAVLRQNILVFFADLNAPYATKKKKKKWERTVEQLEVLKTVQGAR